MKRLYSFAVCIALVCLVVSCGSRNRIDKAVKGFHHSQIKVPLDSMVRLSSKPFPSIYGEAKYIYVMYVDSASCGDCAISHLQDWAAIDLTDAYKSGALKYAFVIAPRQGLFRHVIEKLGENTVYKDFIFVDTAGVFERSNPNLPTNKLLHTFMINTHGEVELIGSPINNSRIKNMLEKIVGGKDCKD
jgi:hypothetical protein